MNGGTYPGSSFCAAFPAFERGELLWQRFVCARFACLSCLRISTPIVSEHLLQWLMGNLGPYTVAPGFTCCQAPCLIMIKKMDIQLLDGNTCTDIIYITLITFESNERSNNNKVFNK